MTREYAVELFNSEIKNFKRLDYSPKEAVQEYIDAMDMAIKALELIPDNATNGDVIKALFSSNPPYDVTFDEKWWDAPYRIAR